MSISLEENPAGDGVYSTDSGTGDDDQNAFERQIEAFADAIYQSTNGKHKLGRVTVFRNMEHWEQADIQWNEYCALDQGPQTWVNGYGVDGYRIYMCTNWDGYGGYDTDEAKGYVLGHEWGHYGYGVFDEYTGSCFPSVINYCDEFQPTIYDTPSEPSIMTQSMNAAILGDPEWLEFSTPGVEPFLSYADGNGENAQARVFGEPAWDTLTRDPLTDPKYPWLDTERTRYTTLVAPRRIDYWVTNSLTRARSELDIVWAGNPDIASNATVWQLMLDHSGSMSNASKWDYAKTSAGVFLDQLIPGRNAMGVGVFNLDTRQVYPISDIPDPDTGVRDSAKARLDAGVATEGGTDIGAGALAALAEIQNFGPGTRPSAVVLLTDGRSAVDVDSVTSAYRAASVALNVFGFGADVDSGLLSALATGTGGQYYFIASPSLATTHRAFAAAKAAVSSSVIVSSDGSVSAPNATQMRPLVFDSGLDTATVLVSYAADTDDISLRLFAPDQTEAATFSCSTGAAVSCQAAVDIAERGAGTYTLEIVNRTAEARETMVLVSADPVATPDRADIAVQFDDTNYPESFTVSAIVRKGYPLTGLDVTAEIETPGGILKVVLSDDGLNADTKPDDGRYTAEVPYFDDGTYTAVVTASNAAGRAQTTAKGLLPAHSLLDTTHIPVDVTENFTRVSIKTALAAGVAWDDHADDPEVPTRCTTIDDDNIDTAGRIDTELDVDCFYLSPTSTGDDLVARLSSLTSGIRPELRVYNAAGTVELLYATLDTHRNTAGGISLPIPTATLGEPGYVLTVNHSDRTADAGGYAISAGAMLPSDDPDNGGGNGSGGALGPWSLLLAALLALVGLRQRPQVA